MHRVKNYEAECSRFDCPKVTFRDGTGGHIVELTAGGLCGVELEVFREHGYTYILSWNDKHPFVGLEKFLGHEPKRNLSLGKKEAIDEVLGKRGINPSPMTMVKRLASYLVAREEAG